jgi:urease accessory protein
VIASASALVHPDGVLGLTTSQPPLTLRQVHSDDPRVCALCLVGSAAGPLAGDQLALSVEVSDQAHASLRATGASIAQGRSSIESSVRLSASVGVDASLVADPGALIVCAGSRVDVAVSLELAATATVEWHETVVLGRDGDAGPGAARLDWDVRRAGRPLLHQRVDLTDPPLGGWLVAGQRVLSSVLIVGPAVEARTVVRSRTAIAQRIDDHALLITVLAPDGASATQQVNELRTAFTPAVVG